MHNMESFLTMARSSYEEAKINYHAGKCTAEQLENVRLSLERLEQAALALPSADRGTS